LLIFLLICLCLKLYTSHLLVFVFFPLPPTASSWSESNVNSGNRNFATKTTGSHNLHPCFFFFVSFPPCNEPEIILAPSPSSNTQKKKKKTERKKWNDYLGAQNPLKLVLNRELCLDDCSLLDKLQRTPHHTLPPRRPACTSGSNVSLDMDRVICSYQVNFGCF
jgi:hypothetical protein